MNPRNTLQSWLDTLTADSEIVIDDDALTLITVDPSGEPTITRCQIPGYSDYDRYKHLTAVAHRRGHDWTPDEHQARILAEGWADGYPALQAFAAGASIEHTGPHELAADIADLLRALEINRHDWPHEGEPGPQIAAVRALQRHVDHALRPGLNRETGRS